MTLGVVELKLAEIAVAFAVPVLFSWTRSEPVSPGSIKVFPLQHTSVAVIVPASKLAEATAPLACIASNGMTIPTPVSLSVPAPSMSIAVLVRSVLICALVRFGKPDLISAAIAPACGAAADVPVKVVGNPPTPVTETRSAAVMSGF